MQMLVTDFLLRFPVEHKPLKVTKFPHQCFKIIIIVQTAISLWPCKIWVNWQELELIVAIRVSWTDNDRQVRRQRSSYFVELNELGQLEFPW